MVLYSFISFSGCHAAGVAPAEDEKGAVSGSGRFSHIRSLSTPRLAHSPARELPSADKSSLEIAASAKLSTGHFRAKPPGNT